jgi:hypothetical protein
VAVTAASLLSPTGRLDRKVLWPGVSASKVNEYLAAYITDGETEAEAITDETAQDRAVKQWAYYRAFDEVYQRLVSQPASVADADEGSQSYLVTQMQLMKERRDEALAAFEAILEEETGEDPAEDSYTVITSLRD